MINFILKWWIAFAFGSIVTICTTMYRKFKCESSEYRATQDGLKSLLRYMIVDIYEKTKDEKKITLYQKEVLMALYKDYIALKGNGFVEDIISEIKCFELITK